MLSGKNAPILETRTYNIAELRFLGTKHRSTMFTYGILGQWGWWWLKPPLLPVLDSYGPSVLPAGAPVLLRSLPAVRTIHSGERYTTWARASALSLTGLSNALRWYWCGLGYNQDISRSGAHTWTSFTASRGLVQVLHSLRVWIMMTNEVLRVTKEKNHIPMRMIH